RSGFISGVMIGALVWAVTLLLPLFERAGIMELHIHDLFDTPISTTDSAFWSLLFNSLAFVVFSILRPQSSDEREAAGACCQEEISLPKGVPQATSIAEFEEQLSKLIGDDFAKHEVERALNDLGLQQESSHSINLTLLRAQIGRNLSGLVGPVLSRLIVNEQLQIDTAAKTAIADTIQFVERKLETSRSQLQGVAGELDALRRFHRQVLEDLPLGVVTISPEQQVVSWNRVMVKLSSLTEVDMVGKRVTQLPDPWSGLLSVFLESNQSLMSQIKTRIGGDPHILNLFKASIAGPSKDEENRGVVVLIEDYSELYKLEEKLVHSERLASIGKLASGVAHEIGNPVTGIACLAQEMLAEPEDKTIQQNGVEQILTQTERISNIVHSLVSFSHVGASMDHPMEPVLIREMVDESISLVSLSHAAKGQHYENCCPDGIEVLGDHQKLQQVFVNLLTNASDASPPSETITIDCSLDGENAQISVTDQGTGIEEKLQSKIFEPFVTTKQAGEGTGLGLSLAYNIVQEHGGTIALESEKNRGTRVDVCIKLFKQEK
ncbi:MAG: ATP-binding protein, partial [Chromatiales bacterium]|nr:ATP-binding protein [Chromatiales bacterium]